MGQTLNHGVYLPAEGERNCYAGLASNWQILNTAVGNIAEKAPLVHTHGNITNDGKVGTTANLPLITGTGGAVQAGAFGNQANTFCEGNDSRLSDARTPVAHTHTKSDVTDLFNSANTWSANNIYTYAITLKQTNLEEGVLPASNQTKRFGITDKNNANLGWLQHRVSASGDSYLELYVVNKFSNGQLSTQGNEISNSLVLGLSSDGSRYLKVLGDISPDLPTRVCNLGTSTNRWKSLNGVNPGALSLPDTLGTSGTENVNYFNVIGYLNNTGTLATIPATATYDGWLYINAKDGADSYIIVDDSPSNFGTSVFGNNGLGAQSIGLLCLMCPIRKGHSYNVRIKSAGIVSARIYPAQGNV